MDKAFRRAVFAAVRRIPRGKVATYGQIAALAGYPRHARQVGLALASTPANLALPWQRVINAAGRISPRLRHWHAGGDDLQRMLLEAEGIHFSAGGKVDLRAFQWRPSGACETRP
jgi:methylated-DNA-protein-cysteine methyltransferase-like protein